MLKNECRTVLTSAKVQWVRVERIRLNPAIPRKRLDPEGLRELTASIREHGLLQPLTLRRTPDGPELAEGERRLRAARLAGLREVPCIFTEDEIPPDMLALIQKLQRDNPDYIEEARGLALLMERCRLSQEQAAARVGKSQSAVANKLRLLRHPAPVLDALRAHHLSERHARALLRLPENQRLAAIETIAGQSWTVAQAEQYIESLLAVLPKAGTARPMVSDIRLFLNSLNRSLAMIRGSGVACGREETEDEIILTIRLPKEAS